MLWALFLAVALLDGSGQNTAYGPQAKATTSRTQQPGPKILSAALSSSKPSPNEDRAAEKELLDLTNRSRREAGLPPLRMDESLTAAAGRHALLMLENAQLDHQFAGEQPLLLRIADVSPLRMDRAGENLAKNFSAEGAHKALMLSPPHRRNLLDSRFNVAGIAAIWRQGQLYVVEDFGREVATHSPEQTEKLVSEAVKEARQHAGLPALARATAPGLDDAVCALAQTGGVDAASLPAMAGHRSAAAYTQSEPEILPPGVMRLLRDGTVRQFAVGSCYARSQRYPAGTYWVAVVLY